MYTFLTQNCPKRGCRYLETKKWRFSRNPDFCTIFAKRQFFFIFFAVVLLAIYHKLLNGSFLGSPYNYSDNEFSSFSISNFKLTEVLFSTWHGLLFYHPFYLLSIFLLLIIFFKKLFSKDNSKWILLITSIVFFIQLLIQSSHATWWMGTGTYGARGFAGISILTFYAILNIKNNFKPIKYNFFFLNS